MSAPDPKWAAEARFPIPPEPQDHSASADAATLPTNTEEEMDSKSLFLLREFFLLLDQWDREQEG
jgi:hypothetical protein